MPSRTETMTDSSAAPPSDTSAALARDAGIDLVRVLGLIAVVVGHVYATVPLVRELTYSWHMPVFFFLTGYLWNPRRDLRSEWRARLKSLMLPYLVWVVILFAIYAVWAAVTPGSIDPGRLGDALLGGANAGSPFVTLWFVSALFFVALLFRAVCRLPAAAQWGAAVLGVAAGALFPHALSDSPLAIGMALPCLIFVVAGAAFQSVRHRITRPVLVGLPVLGVSVALVLLQAAKPVDLKHLDFGTPVVSVAVAVAISASLLLLAEPAMRQAPARFGRWMTLLALASLTVVFLHPMLMWFVHPESLLLKFLIVLAVPWALGVAAAYTPATRWLNGAKLRVQAPRQRSVSAS